MSYHDGIPPQYSTTGIGVVNPLRQIERKLKKIQDVLDDISEGSTLSANELKVELLKVIDDG